MKKRWIFVFAIDDFCTEAKLKNPKTLEEARDFVETDPVCLVFKEQGHKFLGILGVDIQRSDLKKMGYQV